MSCVFVNGPDGAGKSTLIGLLAAELRRTEALVTVLPSMTEYCRQIVGDDKDVREWRFFRSSLVEYCDVMVSAVQLRSREIYRHPEIVLVERCEEMIIRGMMATIATRCGDKTFNPEGWFSAIRQVAVARSLKIIVEAPSNTSLGMQERREFGFEWYRKYQTYLRSLCGDRKFLDMHNLSVSRESMTIQDIVNFVSEWSKNRA